ncbi:hypothetical protein OG413_00735 [Streptomyces sp. NBC_01433]|uniref:hypothetical protein n=1 Tax=Streptomyces sp. NBC_01433 TaxID=2903864 RepID=UPI002251972A|nr:hypothetical protein [Streptomyces sp. NBC_01433]MCX4673861.1 hypothetical protein [Streptomyces sp. NBC_01433]
MERTRLRRGGALAMLLATALLTGCGQGDGGGGGRGGDGSGASDAGAGKAAGPVSVSALRALADKVGPDGADDCPLPYDITRAAKAAGLSGETGAGGAAGGDADAPAVTAENGRDAEGPGGFAANPGALVSCLFHVGAGTVEVHTIATQSASAENLLAPVIMSAGGFSTEKLTAYLKRTGAGAPGEAVASENGDCVTVRVRPTDDGDASLVVTAGEDGTSGPGREKLSGLALALHAQLA